MYTFPWALRHGNNPDQWTKNEFETWKPRHPASSALFKLNMGQLPWTPNNQFASNTPKKSFRKISILLLWKNHLETQLLVEYYTAWCVVQANLLKEVENLCVYASHSGCSEKGHIPFKHLWFWIDNHYESITTHLVLKHTTCASPNTWQSSYTTLFQCMSPRLAVWDTRITV